MAEPSTRPERRSWERLTILDLLLLLLAFALGFALIRPAHDTGREDPQSSAEASGVELVLLGLVFGSALAAPITLSSHYLFRGRREPPRPAELLWLAPSTGFALTWGVSYLSGLFAQGTPLWLVLWIAVQLVFSLSALLIFCERMAQHANGGTVRWTEWFGFVACMAVGILMLYAFIVSMGR